MDVVPRRRCAPSAGPPTIASLWAEVSGRELTDTDLEWPPDVFALVGTVLGRTHAYRFAVSPPAGRHWPPRGCDSWNGDDLRRRRAAGPPGPRSPRARRRRWSPTPGRCCATGRRRRWRTSPTARDWPVCEALLILLAAQRRDLRRRRRRARPDARRRATGSAARADELLARTGSLSRLPTHRLRVLPEGAHAARRHLVPVAVALPLPARSGGGRRLAQGAGAAVGARPAAGQRAADAVAAAGPRSGTSGRCPDRSGGRRTSRSASSSSPRPSPSTSTWSSGRCGGALDEVDGVDAVDLPGELRARSATSSRWRRCSPATA